MMDTQQLISEIQKLPLDSQRELLESLSRRINTQPQPSGAINEDEVERILAAKGIITLPPEAANYTDDEEDFEPVEFTGQPLSEMIIEERR